MYNKAGIDEKKIRNSVFLSPDAKKVLTPEPVMHTITSKKEEITVSYKVGTKLKTIRKAIEGRSCYAAESCPEHILTSEEVADREDPNRNSDAFAFAEPELDEEKVTPLAMGEKLDRYAWFVAVCNRVSEPDVLTYILENVPRKKNGLLAKGKPVVVAALPIVFTAQMGYYEIVGKVKSETAFELALQERKFSEEEWMLTRDNVYLRFLETGKRPILTDVKLTKVKLWHIRNGDKTTIEIPAIQLDSGKLAIAAMPYRPISDFSSVRGDDKKGYEILEPENLPRKTVCSNGITTNFVFDVQNSSLGIWT